MTVTLSRALPEPPSRMIGANLDPPEHRSEVSRSARLPPEAELTWLLAQGSRRRGRDEDRIRALAAGVPTDRLAAEMDRQRARLILGPRAQQIGITDARFDARLEELRSQARGQGLLFEALIAQAATLLEDHQIEALPLKGTTLAAAAHGDISVRLPQDLDLLVPRDKMDIALDVLGSLGYARSKDEMKSAVHVVLRPSEDWMPRLEVHWRVHWYGDRFASRLLAGSTPGEHGVRVAHASADMAALLLFYAKDGFAGLRLAIDIAALADRAEPRITVESLLAHADDDPEIRSALVTALEVARSTVAAELDGPTQVLSTIEARAARLANWSLTGEIDQIRATTRLVDLLLTPRTRRSAFVSQRFQPFASRRDNVAYGAKTFVRWVPALAAVAGRRTPHPVPSVGPSKLRYAST